MRTRQTQCFTIPPWHADIDFGITQHNILSHALQVLSDIAQKAGLREGRHVTLDLQISAYVDDAGACDRIQKTCIPQSYTRHTSRKCQDAS